MKRSVALALAVSFALTAAIVVVGARIAAHARSARVELGRVKTAVLSEATLAELAALEDEVFLTYYVTARADMPSHMRRVERAVTDLLEALRDASDGKLDFQILDPDAELDPTRPDLARYAARRGIAPFRARSVDRDAYSERTVWSSLTIAYGTRPEIAINGIGPDHIPRLQRVFTEHLRQLREPRRAVVALAVGAETTATYANLSDMLARTCQVVEVDLEAGEAIPETTDLLLWLDPSRVSAPLVRDLEELLARGRSIVVAGSEWDGGLTVGAAGPSLRMRRTSYDADSLLASFGLRPVRGLVLDERCQAVEWQETQLPLPFAVSCIAPNQDFRTLVGQPNGTLHFDLPTPIALDAAGLSRGGWEAEVLATTSEKTRLGELPAGDAAEIPLQQLVASAATPSAKQALAVLLRPADPWHGSLVAFAASTPFRDGRLDAPNVAHPRLVRTLLDNLASDDRLVLDRAGALPREPLPALGGGARVFWRLAALLPAPLLLLALALVRGIVGRSSAGLRVRAWPSHSQVRVGRRFATTLVALVAGLAVVITTTIVAGQAATAADWTEGDVNSLAEETRALARDLGERGTVSVELVLSGRERLSPAMRPWARRIETLLRDLERAGADLDVRRIRPEESEEAERTSLLAEGIEPFQVTTHEEEVTTVRTVWSSLRLARDGRVEVLRLHDERAIEELEFRLAFALWRLDTGERPHVVFAADTPRLSAAEAFEYFQQQGLFSPMGTDVYSLARRTLLDSGFRLTHVNLREPSFPADTEDVDAVVWLQPRRPVEDFLTDTVAYLHGGGNVMIAAQHFNIQPRQYRGTGFEMVYWPQPQSPDVEIYYLPELGIRLVREVLFDELKTRMPVATQVNRAYARPDFERQAQALPFLIRASAANFAADSPITRNLGDQAFIWASPIEWDEEVLAEHGLKATPLITTSERTWSLRWKGGWIPEALLAGPERIVDEDGEVTSTGETLGRIPLVAMFEGVFPVPDEPFTLPMFEAPPEELKADERSTLERAREQSGEPGRLLLVGCSEMFKDYRLLEPEFRADHLLVNAVASLALDENLAAIAAHRKVAPGFDYVRPEARFRWRLLVIAAAPAALVLFGFARTLLRSRPPQVRRASRGAAR